jgi:hypothetical protein
MMQQAGISHDDEFKTENNFADSINITQEALRIGKLPVE